MEIQEFNPPEADDSGSDGFSDRENNATTTYSLNWIIYTGKTESQFPLNDMVIYLLRPYHNQRHSVFMDNYYTSLDLFRTLLTYGFGFVGTAENWNKEINEYQRNKDGELWQDKLLYVREKENIGEHSI